MTSDLKLTLVQTSLHWHNPETNRQMLAQKLSTLTEPTDLIVLPEMFTTGFSMEAPALAETMNGPTLSWLAEQAQLHQAVITGSIIINEADKYYNRLIWMRPDGNSSFYDKRHLFRMAGETNIYTAGTSKSIFALKGWQVCPLVCYDLRFPVWSRNKQNQYDLLLFVANWPEKRRLAWQTLLQARAIENLTYVAGVNRVGEDANGISYAGDSVVHQPNGEVIWQKSYIEDLYTLTLSKKNLNLYRETFPAYLDADDFTLV